MSKITPIDAFTMPRENARAELYSLTSEITGHKIVIAVSIVTLIVLIALIAMVSAHNPEYDTFILGLLGFLTAVFTTLLGASSFYLHRATQNYHTLIKVHEVAKTTVNLMPNESSSTVIESLPAGYGHTDE